MNRDHLVVELLRHHQDSTLWVQMEELGAVLMEAAVDGEHQFAIGVGVLRADLQDVLPGGRVLGNPYLKTHGNTGGNGGSYSSGNEKENKCRKQWGWKMDIKMSSWTFTFQFEHNFYSQKAV